MYAQITPKGINITDKTSFSRDDFSFNNGPGGLLIKIGSEIENNSKLATIMYKLNYSLSVPLFSVSIKFGDHNKKENWDDKFEAIVDTGCTVTTFDESVMVWLKNVYPLYTTVSTQAFVVGGPTAVDRSYIDIEFCGKLFERHDVHFAKLSSIALIGTDILNCFKLDIDSGTRISITCH